MSGGNPFSMLPMATQAAGQNNTQGGKGALSSPWGGSGMDLQRGMGILDPLNISGQGGMSKGSLQAFLDPAGIDSGSYGLNLFGKRPDPNSMMNGGVPSVLPNLGINAQSPHGGFMPVQQGGGLYNQMAANSAGRLFNPSLGQPSPSMGVKGSPGAPGAKGNVPTGHPLAAMPQRIHPPANGRFGGGY